MVVGGSFVWLLGEILCGCWGKFCVVVGGNFVWLLGKIVWWLLLGENSFGGGYCGRLSVDLIVVAVFQVTTKTTTATIKTEP